MISYIFLVCSIQFSISKLLSNQLTVNMLTLDKSPETIAGMFDKVAVRYDLLNDVMTGFSHRLTRKIAVKLSRFSSGQKALDVATGTGDFAFLLAKRAPGGEVIGVDISQKMLAGARYRQSKNGLKNVRFEYGNALDLNFEDETFDVATIGYGIRNVPDPVRAMEEIRRVMRPHGRFLIVEATPPVSRYMRFLANFHFAKLVPLIAKFLTPDSDAYHYFAKSVEEFPTAPEFAKLIKKAGWAEVYYRPMYFGTVTVFLAIR
ncbi:MAG: bifunctional demethylmenaquinone methyltransferase/2-methoxy-6-polyprenyl-1,4-benzoquinol methylase UbiE [Methanobacteriota archaeon]|nr:MAG: bifunctional demethylmenaquinone methyltransferase/2-methoxy-6-polyprenyl-1,4-benzoquinol methylase UbiE [Euryarchaeota archaeon]